MGIWEVKRDVDRAQWTFTPWIGVGPLRFGMSPEEVGAALDSAHAQPFAQVFTEVGVTVFYTESVRLAGVAVNALNGPQVRLGGTALVGCVPSELERWISDHATAHGLDLRYTHEGNPGSVDLGLIIRVQRAGDVVLSRPLFLIREWVLEPWDYIPGFEWSTL
ncbi:MAG TPA: hypothetical protein VFS83_12870 [Ktedonobacterales bacterium]|nr:hypothetical protein [Ktedonobacterales bacterium]